MSLLPEPFRKEAHEPLPSPRGYALDEPGPYVVALRRAGGSSVVVCSGGESRGEGTRETVEDTRAWEPFGPAPRALPSGIAGHRRRRDHLETRPPGPPPYWLMVRHRPDGAEVLAIGGVAGELALPIFGSREGAREFLRSYASKGGWEATPVGVGKLLSLLCGSCAIAGCVALDPSPEIVAEGATGLVSLPRQSFVDSLLGRGRTWFEGRYREEGQAHG